MAIQMTGMASGLDTEAMITDLVNASSAKKTKLEGEQTKVEWTQKAWDELNTDVYSFFSKQVESLKWESAYAAKKTTVTDASIAKVVSSENAICGTQSLAVAQLAKTGYLTGGQISGAKNSSTLGELGILADGESASISVNGNSISLSSTTTISSLVSQMNNAGVIASFDENNQRFFISAKASGKENDFKLNADNESGLKALAQLGILSADDVVSSEYSALASLVDDPSKADDDYDKALAEDSQKLAEKYYKSTKDLEAANVDLQNDVDEAQTKLDAIKKTFFASRVDAEGNTDVTNQEMADYAAANLEAAQTKLDDLTAERVTMEGNGATAEELEAKSAEIEAQAEQLSMLKQTAGLVNQVNSFTDIINANEATITKNKDYYNVVDEAEGKVSAKTAATDEAKKNLDAKIKTAKDAIAAANRNAGTGLASVRVVGQDAKIFLNGAEFTSDKNTFSINGLTITATGVSEKDGAGYKATTISTDTDVDAIYDKIVKTFAKYNELLTSFDKKYNADSAKDYKMLTKEQKEDMKDDEIETWENKIKDSLLRKDENLGALLNIFQTSMLRTYTIDGKAYSLSSFGIETLSYFESAEHEKNNYHIDGNADDENTSEKADKLKSAIASNPEAVTKFFSQLMSDFYNDLNERAKSTDYSSRNKFYDDKMLKTNYDDYKTKISDQQTYLDNMESRYRKQFTAMEKALTSLNSQTSYLSNLFTAQ